jgi:hypothetical protein
MDSAEAMTATVRQAAAISLIGRHGMTTGASLANRVREEEHSQLHQPRANGRIFGGVPVLAKERDVLLVQRFKFGGGVVAAGAGGSGPLPMKARLIEQPLE